MVISTLEDEDTVLGAIDACASRYLLEDQSSEKLEQAIADMLAGDASDRKLSAEAIKWCRVGGQ